jgi:hypothetical protein
LQHHQLLGPLNHPEDAPAVVHLPDSKFPVQLVPFDVLNGRNPGILGQLEVIKKQAVSNVHAMKHIPVSNRDVEFFWRFGDSQHGSDKAIHQESTPGPRT